MLRTLFETGSMSDATGAAPVLMELGPGYCLLSQWNIKSNGPHFVRLWSFEPAHTEESLDKVFEIIEAAGIEGQAMVAGAAFPQLVAVPKELAVDGTALLQALYALPQKDILHHEQETLFFYAFPQAMQHRLRIRFRKLRLVPAQAGFIAKNEWVDDASSIHAFFIHNIVRVTVYKNGTLHLMQQYEYTAPLDVVYYLLKIGTEFGLSQQETPLYISGFIAAESALFQELHQYFLHFRFAESGTVIIDEQAFPRHYFSSLHNLAACAL